MPVHKKAARPVKRRRLPPEETWDCLVNLHERTAARLQSLHAAHGFGSADVKAQAPEPEPIPLSFALDATEDPDLMRATFVVPPSVALKMLDTITSHTTTRGAAA